MAHLVFTDQPTVAAFAAAIDADFGYPKDGVRMGGGIHVSRAEGRTTRYAATLRHPTLNRWAYPEDPVVVGKEARVPVPGGASRQTLDATWDGASSNFVAAQLE